MSQVASLLECHKVYLYHRPEEFYLITMFGDVDGELMPIRFKTTAEGKTKCAWPDCASSSARQYCEYIQRPWRECQLPESGPSEDRPDDGRDEGGGNDEEESAHRQSAQGGATEGEQPEHETWAGAASGRLGYGGGIGE